MCVCVTKRLSVQCLYLQCEHEGEKATTVQSEATREPEDELCFKHFLNCCLREAEGTYYL